jgi:hypothetical protein
LLDPGRGGHQPGTEYKYLGIWFQEDGGWDHHADKALKMRSAYGWRPLLACARLPTRSACSCYRPLFTQRSRTEQGLGLYTVDARANVGGSQEGRARHLGTAPMDCSCDALYRDTGLMAGALIDAAFAGMTNVSTPPGRWIKCALDFSYTGRRCGPKVGTD